MPEESASHTARPEILHTPTSERAGFAVAAQPLGFWTKLYANGTFRKTVLLVLLAAAWEIYARALGQSAALPDVHRHGLGACSSSIAAGEIPTAGLYTLSLLLKGYVAGLFFAALLTAFASVSRIGADLLETLTAMFNPLPSIALLPLALIWFGLGRQQRHLRARARRALGRRAEYVRRVPRAVADAAHGRPELRPIERRPISCGSSSPALFRAFSRGSRSAGRSRGER